MSYDESQGLVFKLQAVEQSEDLDEFSVTW
jgi:hypothetical protein